ncbi:hypothetical protein WICPIJ_000717, partial [Wickerhamomyces pijperi]
MNRIGSQWTVGGVDGFNTVGSGGDNSDTGFDWNLSTDTTGTRGDGDNSGVFSFNSSSGSSQWTVSGVDGFNTVGSGGDNSDTGFDWNL